MPDDYMANCMCAKPSKCDCREVWLEGEVKRLKRELKTTRHYVVAARTMINAALAPVDRPEVYKEGKDD